MWQSCGADEDRQYFSQLLGAGSLSKALRRRYWLVRVAQPSGVVLNTGAGLDAPNSANERGRTVVSVDISEWALRQSHGLRICADSEALPIRSGAVSGVLALDVLEHLERPQLALSEIRRALADNGRVAISVPNDQGMSARLAKRTGQPDRWVALSDETHRSLLSPQQWRDHIEDAELVIEREGTDAPWAAPYMDRWTTAQRIAARLLMLISVAVSPILPWRFGENLIVVAQRLAPPLDRSIRGHR